MVNSVNFKLLFRHLTAKEDYAKFYDLDSSDDEEEDEENRVKQLKKKKVLQRKNSNDSSDEDSDSDDDDDDAAKNNGGGGEEEGVEDDEKEEDRVADELGPEIVAKLRDDSVDYARGREEPFHSFLTSSLQFISPPFILFHLISFKGFLMKSA